VEGNGGNVKSKNGTSNCGAALLGELKALVDSFPDHQRTDVIEILDSVFKELSADNECFNEKRRWKSRPR
jgi:hypothetical protein